ncbi:unnamed protein product [Closterium sp. NIES-53]
MSSCASLLPHTPSLLPPTRSLLPPTRSLLPPGGARGERRGRLPRTPSPSTRPTTPRPLPLPPPFLRCPLPPRCGVGQLRDAVAHSHWPQQHCPAQTLTPHEVTFESTQKSPCSSMFRGVWVDVLLDCNL